jgi:hypothetical protein
MGQSSPYPGQNNGPNSNNNGAPSNNNMKNQPMKKASTFQQLEADVAQANKM